MKTQNETFKGAKVLYISVYSITKIKIRAVSRFYDLNKKDIKDWREKKNVDIFTQFLRDKGLKAHEVLEEVRMSNPIHILICLGKKKKLKYFANSSSHLFDHQFMTSTDEINRRPFLKSIVVSANP